MRRSDVDWKFEMGHVSAQANDEHHASRLSIAVTTLTLFAERALVCQIRLFKVPCMDSCCQDELTFRNTFGAKTGFQVADTGNQGVGGCFG